MTRAVWPGLLRLAAGACYVAIQDVVGERLVRHWSLPRSGRRVPASPTVVRSRPVRLEVQMPSIEPGNTWADDCIE